VIVFDPTITEVCPTVSCWPKFPCGSIIQLFPETVVVPINRSPGLGLPSICVSAPCPHGVTSPSLWLGLLSSSRSQPTKNPMLQKENTTIAHISPVIMARPVCLFISIFLPLNWPRRSWLACRWCVSSIPAPDRMCARPAAGCICPVGSSFPGRSGKPPSSVANRRTK
jgi:hypothetical protein